MNGDLQQTLFNERVKVRLKVKMRLKVKVVLMRRPIWCNKLSSDESRKRSNIKSNGTKTFSVWDIISESTRHDRQNIDS